MNLADATTALWLTRGHFPNFQIPADPQHQSLVAGAWLDVLGDMELADVRVALGQLDAQGERFPPTPGLIRQAILRRRGVLAPDVDLAEAEVFAAFRRQSERCRGGLSPEVSHPAINEAMRALGGWREAGQMPTDRMVAAFRRAYESAAKRADHEAVEPPIATTTAPELSEASDHAALPAPTIRKVS